MGSAGTISSDRHCQFALPSLFIIIMIIKPCWLGRYSGPEDEHLRIHESHDQPERLPKGYWLGWGLCFLHMYSSATRAVAQNENGRHLRRSTGIALGRGGRAARRRCQYVSAASIDAASRLMHKVPTWLVLLVCPHPTTTSGRLCQYVLCVCCKY